MTSGLCARAHSRAVFTAIKMLSVPPLVIVPAASGWWNISATAASTSVSHCRSPGNAMGFSAFSEKYARDAS